MQCRFQPRYDVICQSDGLTYTFQTDNGSTYKLEFVHFDVFAEVPTDSVYAFNIDRIVRSRQPDDSIRIRNTVAYVISIFFRQIDNAIITSCEVDDGMQRGRKRLFDRWFNQMNDGNILTLSAQQQTGLGLTDATLYYHRENIFRPVLEREFREYIDLMNELN